MALQHVDQTLNTSEKEAVSAGYTMQMPGNEESDNYNSYHQRKKHSKRHGHTSISSTNIIMPTS